MIPPALEASSRAPASGKTIAERLARAEETADRIEREMAGLAAPVARDEPKSGK